MLDRIVSLEPLREGRGLKAVSAADCPVPEGPPTAPVLPGPLVLHGLCALAEAVFEGEGERRPVLESVEEALFLDAVGPGEVLSYRGAAVVRARLRYRLVEAADDPLAAAWRGLKRSLLSGEDPPILR